MSPIEVSGTLFVTIAELRERFPGGNAPCAETIRRLIRRKKLPARKLGKRYWFSLPAFERLYFRDTKK